MGTAWGWFAPRLWGRLFSLSSCSGCPMPEEMLRCGATSAVPSRWLAATSSLQESTPRMQIHSWWFQLPHNCPVQHVWSPKPADKLPQPFRRRVEGVSLQQQKPLLKWGAKSYFSVPILKISPWNDLPWASCQCNPPR